MSDTSGVLGVWGRGERPGVMGLETLPRNRDTGRREPLLALRGLPAVRGRAESGGPQASAVPLPSVPGPSTTSWGPGSSQEAPTVAVTFLHPRVKAPAQRTTGEAGRRRRV